MLAALTLAAASVLVPSDAPVTAPAGSTLGDAIAAVTTAQVSLRSIPAEGKTFELGHLRLQLDSGNLYPVLAADGSALGLLFLGKGTYRYGVSDERERYVFLRNLKRLAPNLIPEESVIEDRFERALLLSTRPLLPPETAPGEPGPLASAQEAFARWGKRLQKSDLPFEHLLAEARASDDGRSFQYAEIEGAFATLGFRLDRLRTFDESVATFRTISGIEPRLEEVLAFQDIPDPRAGPQLVLRHLELALRSEDRRSARITARLEVEPAFAGQRILRFVLLNQRDPRLRLWNSPKNALHVRAVTDGEGRALPFSHRHAELLVEVPEPASSGARIVLRVEYEGEILTALDWERGDQYVELCSVPWFPQPGDPEAPPFTYTLSISMPKPFLPVASGTTTALRETERSFELESRGTSPARWIGIFAGRYHLHEATEGGVRYRVHAYAMGNKAGQEGLVRLAAAAVSELTARLGPAPFEELDVVELPSWPHPMAASGIAVITAQQWTGPRQRVGGNDTVTRFAFFVHALARQWVREAQKRWVRPDDWLESAITHYVTGEVATALEPPDRGPALWRSCLAEWRGYDSDCAEAAPLSRADALGGELGAGDRVCLLSSRGPLVLHMLRAMVGEDRFRQIVRALVQEAAKDALTTSDLQAAISAASPADLSWFASQWADQWGTPRVDARWDVDGSTGTNALQVSLAQLDGPLFRLVLPLVLEYGDKRREVHLLVHDRRQQEVRLTLSGRPAKISLDPANNNLAVYR